MTFPPGAANTYRLWRYHLHQDGCRTERAKRALLAPLAPHYRRVMDRTRDMHAFKANGHPIDELAQSIAVGRAVVRLFAHDYVSLRRIGLRRLKSQR